MNQPDHDAATNTKFIPPFNIQFESGEFAVRHALGQFLEALVPLELNIEEKGMVELVMAEVLNNIVEHAYPGTAENGPIDITCTHQSDGLKVEIRDEGKAMPAERLPTGRLASVDVDLQDMPEGGFGWFLIQHLAKDVIYRRVGRENQLRMRLVVSHQS